MATASNAGPSDAQTVELSGLVPVNTTFVSFAQTSGPAFNLTSPAVGGTGTLSGTIATLAAGASASFDLTVMVAPNTPNATTITNTVDVSTATTDPNLSNNSSTVTTGSATGTGADVSVTIPTSASTIVAGSAAGYTITVSNAGPDAAQTVALSELVPANTTFVSDTQTSGPTFTLSTPAQGGTGTINGTIGTLASGASASFDVVVLLSPSTPAGTTITNTAEVTTATSDPNLANNSQTVTNLTAAQADLSATATTGAGPVIAGKTISYTIELANAGPSDAQDVVGSVAIPAHTIFIAGSQTSGPAFTIANPTVGGTSTITASIATLAPGASATFSLVLLLSPSTPAGTMFTSTGDVTSATPDPNPANNTQINTYLTAAQADLSVTNTIAAGPVFAGNPITYTVTVSNAGPSNAQTVGWTDVVPANTTLVSAAQTSGPAFTLTSPAAGSTGTIGGTIGTLASGASASFTVVVRVSPGTPNGTTIADTAEATTATTDPNLADNSQTVTTHVVTPVLPGPAVVELKRYGENSQRTILVVWFNLPLDPAGAEDVGNYRIVTVGGSGRGRSGRGHVTRVKTAVYNPAVQTVTLRMAQPLALTWIYQITITGAAPDGLKGTDGAPLDGAGNGTPGSNFVGMISRRTLAGPSRKAKRASQTSKAGETPLARAISPSAVDKLAVARQLTAREASAKNLRRWIRVRLA